MSDDIGFELDAVRTSGFPSRELMRKISSPASWPAWQPEITETDGPAVVGPGDVVSGKARMLGFAVHGHSTTVDAGPGHLEEDVLVGVRMRVRYEVEDAAAGSRVRHRLHLYPLEGPAGRVLALVLRWRLKRMQRQALVNLTSQSAEPSP